MPPSSPTLVNGGDEPLCGSGRRHDGTRRRRTGVAQVAGRELAGENLPQHGLFPGAAVEGIGAAGVEAAARGRVDRARHIPAQDDALFRRIRVGHRHRREQRLGIGVLRPRKQ